MWMKKQYGSTSLIELLLIALIAGFTKFLYSVAKGTPMNVVTLGLNLASAITAGFITGSLCESFHLDPGITKALIASSGWAGVALLEVIDKQIRVLLPEFFGRIKLMLNVAATKEFPKPEEKEQQKEDK